MLFRVSLQPVRPTGKHQRQQQRNDPFFHLHTFPTNQCFSLFFHPFALFLWQSRYGIVYRIFRRCAKTFVLCRTAKKKPRGFFLCGLPPDFYVSLPVTVRRAGTRQRPAPAHLHQTGAVSVQRPAARVLTAQVLHLPGQHIAGAPAAHAVRVCAAVTCAQRYARQPKNRAPRPLARGYASHAGTMFSKAKRVLPLCSGSHSPSRSGGRDNPPPVLPRPQPATSSHRCTGC